jgi:hypothetical protein
VRVSVGARVPEPNGGHFFSLPTFSEAPDPSSLPACRQACAPVRRFLARPQIIECECGCESARSVSWTFFPPHRIKVFYSFTQIQIGLYKFILLPY